MQPILTFLSFLRSKAVQIALAVGFTVLVLLKARNEIREDAVEDTTREMEKRDEARAQSIRDRVADVPERVRVDPADTRGYRD